MRLVVKRPTEKPVGLREDNSNVDIESEVVIDIDNETSQLSLAIIDIYIEWYFKTFRFII